MNQLTGSGVQYDFNNVERWSRHINIFEYDKLFFPLNNCNTHWCLAVVFIPLKLIRYYDSSSAVNGRRYCNWIKKWLSDVAVQSGQQLVFNIDEVVIEDKSTCIPQQDNSYDCGVFVLLFIDFLTDNLPFSFTQYEVGYFRRKIVIDIVRGKLLYDLSVEERLDLLKLVRSVVICMSSYQIFQLLMILLFHHGVRTRLLVHL